MSDAPKLPKGLPVESFDPGDRVYTEKDMEDFRAEGERAARAAAFREAIAACGAEAAGFRKNRLWGAVAGIQACIDALRARAEGDGEKGR